MLISKFITILGVIALSVSFAQTQVKSKPNLSGTWTVDFTKSEKTNNAFEDSEKSVTIQHTEPEIRMIRQYGSFSLPLIVFSDERGETYKSPVSGMSGKSKTKWDGDKLVIHYIGGGISGTAVRSVNVIEEWKLSKDGQTLTKKITLVFPRNAPDRVNAVPVSQPNLEYKKVYNRAS